MLLATLATTKFTSKPAELDGFVGLSGGTLAASKIKGSFGLGVMV